MEQVKTFGQWLRAWHLEQGLTIQELVSRSGVDLGTISRTENEHTQATLSTVTRLCQSLGVTSRDLFLGLFGGEPSPEFKPPDGAHQERGILSPGDVRSFLDLYLGSPDAGLDILASLSNIVSRHLFPTEERAHVARGEEQVGTQSFPMPSDLLSSEVDRGLISVMLGAPSPLYKPPRIRYPALSASSLTEIYSQGGLIIEEDLSSCIFSRKLKSFGSAELDRRYGYVRDSLEARSTERLKSADVLWLDETFAMAGQLLGMLWNIVAEPVPPPSRVVLRRG